MMDRRITDRRHSATEIEVPELRELFRILYKRRWLLIILTALPVMAGMVYLKNKPDYYSATASVLLETQEVRLPDISELLTNMKFDNLTVPTQVSVISSPSLIRRTITLLKLRVDDKGNLLLPNPEEEFDAGKKLPDPDSTERYKIFKTFLSNLQVKQEGTARVIEISFRSVDPFLAAQVANTHAKQYVYSREQDKKRLAEELDKWLSEEIKDLKEQSLIKSRAVQKFRAENGMVQGKNSQELIYQQISDLASQQAQIDTRVVDLHARAEMLQSGNPHGLTDIVQSRLIQDLKARASQTAQKLQSLRAELGSKHPDVQGAREELSQINSDIAREVANVKKSIENELTTVTKQKELLEEKMTRLQKQADDLQEKMITLQALQLEEQASSKLLDNFLARSEEIKSQIDFTRPDVSIVSLAETPGEPTSSKKALIFAAICAFSGFFALSVVFFLEIGNQGVRNREDVSRLSGLPLLGALPRTRLPISGILKKDRSPYLEEMKRIFIHLNSQEHGKTILFTSSRRGEGKTTIASSLAYYMHNIGIKTLLVDADTLVPVIAGVTMINEKPGFSELLSGKAELEDVVVQDKYGLSIIPAGEPTPYISDMLLAGRLNASLDILRENFECIIFDCAPVLTVSDAEILTGMVDQVVIVVESGKTPREEFKKSASILRNLARQTPNVILNKVKFSDIQSN
ncbi:MAG: polysaccharide biosynthesis tyrosine autokinase [Alphaproteobacteria bacterium]|nr:polysaccharide biosynthesis tyrosine autokinase [Alphaproteobacteria bacterium]MCB9974709.1 polysaccharide biosynthesis tyrosine autokinase [Rhodospirillales bacterium]